jgi:hypothetical protein
VFTTEEKPLLQAFAGGGFRDQHLDIWAQSRPERTRGLGKKLLLRPVHTHRRAC